MGGVQDWAGMPERWQIHDVIDGQYEVRGVHEGGRDGPRLPGAAPAVGNLPGGEDPAPRTAHHGRLPRPVRGRGADVGVARAPSACVRLSLRPDARRRSPGLLGARGRRQHRGLDQGRQAVRERGDGRAGQDRRLRYPARVGARADTGSGPPRGLDRPGGTVLVTHGGLTQMSRSRQWRLGRANHLPPRKSPRACSERARRGRPRIPRPAHQPHRRRPATRTSRRRLLQRDQPIFPRRHRRPCLDARPPPSLGCTFQVRLPESMYQSGAGQSPCRALRISSDSSRAGPGAVSMTTSWMVPVHWCGGR